MKKIDFERKAEVIGDFLRFAEMDLSSSPTHETYRHLGKLLGFSYWVDEDIKEQLKGKEWGEIVNEIQREWRKALDWLVNNLDKGYNLVFESPFQFAWGIEEKAHFVYMHGSTTEYLRPIKFKILDNTKPQMEYKDEVTFPAITIKFLENLHTFPKASLRHCLHCKKIFFNPTKRVKRYCSLHCQNTAAVKRMRKKEEVKKN